MKQPDFEEYHEAKCRLKDAIELLPEGSELRYVAKNHTRACECHMAKMIDAAIQGGLEDMRNIKEMIDASSQEAG